MRKQIVQQIVEISCHSQGVIVTIKLGLTCCSESHWALASFDHDTPDRVLFLPPQLSDVSPWVSISNFTTLILASST